MSNISQTWQRNLSTTPNVLLHCCSIVSVQQKCHVTHLLEGYLDLWPLTPRRSIESDRAQRVPADRQTHVEKTERETHTFHTKVISILSRPLTWQEMALFVSSWSQLCKKKPKNLQSMNKKFHCQPQGVSNCLHLVFCLCITVQNNPALAIRKQYCNGKYICL